MVYSGDEDVVVKEVFGVARVVVQLGSVTGGVWRRIVTLNRLGDRIDAIRRNDITSNWRAAEAAVGGRLCASWIVDLILRAKPEQRREIAGLKMN